MTESSGNPWKRATFGLLIVLALVLATGLVVANWSPSKPEPQPPAPAGKPAARDAQQRHPGAGRTAATQAPAPPMPVSVFNQPAPGAADAPPAGARPTQADIDACNRYASGPTGPTDKTWEIGKDTVIGGAATAALGAAAGAIAGGGRGAGKGAAIGGIVGAAGGALYGINENRKHDEAYRAAYQQCMRSRGFAS